MIIAIDGPAGAGKSSVARILADRLGFSYLDTGALYRASALKAKRINLPFEESPEIRTMMSEIDISFEADKVYLDGEDVSEKIRLPETSHLASVISAIPSVRELLLPLQRRVGNARDTVADGRDMGTVVFPDAKKKIFLDASSKERAKRRWLELLQKGVDVSEEEVEKEMNLRDKRDSSRSVAPLKKAKDAVYINTDGLGINQVVEKLLETVF